MEGRGQQLDRRGVAKVAGNGEGAEKGAEHVFLLTVKVDAERLDVFHRSEARLTVLGRELVFVFGNVANEIYRPPAAWLPVDIGLIVEEVWPILACRFQRA